jgi:hypothetical protein
MNEYYKKGFRSFTTYFDPKKKNEFTLKTPYKYFSWKLGLFVSSFIYTYHSRKFNNKIKNKKYE